MTFWRGLLTGRSHLAFLGGLGLALAIAVAVQRRFPDDPGASATARGSEAMDLRELLELSSSAPPRRGRAPPGPIEEKAARAAWSYFVRNTQPTGLVDSVEGFHATTLWDQGSTLLGMIAAERLGLLAKGEMVKRAGALLEALTRAPVLEAGLPNRSYDTRTLAMVDYGGKPVARGTGWSSIDVARLAVPLSVLAWTEPSLVPSIRALLSRWKLTRLVHDGELVAGDVLPKGEVRLGQEGRLGYEQYAAASLQLLGVDASRARLWRRHLVVLRASGVRVPADDRDPARFGANNAVTSEPFLLLAAEMGLEADWQPLAEALLVAQEARARQTGQLTAVSEDHLDRPPFFVYSAVTEGGEPWRALTVDRSDASAARTVSTKAALGWGTFFEGPYPDRLRAAALELVDPRRGFYSGRYEGTGEPNRALAVNTNGIALEILAAGAYGPLLAAARVGDR